MKNIPREAEKARFRPDRRNRGRDLRADRTVPDYLCVLEWISEHWQFNRNRSVSKPDA